MFKAPLFIKGNSLKKGENKEYGFLRRPSRAGLKRFYATLLFSTRTLHGGSLLDNAGDVLS